MTVRRRRRVGLAVVGGALLLAPGTWAGGDVARPQPTAKQVIRAALALHDVPLAVDPSCADAGTEFGDRTIGDHLAGLMAEWRSTKGRQWLETTCTPDGDGWRCAVTLHRSHGDEEWARGLAFRLHDGRSTPDRDSVRCTGGG